MKTAPFPSNENARLAILENYNSLHTSSQKIFDSIIQLAAEICETPIALISFITKDRQWFKSSMGLPQLTGISRDISFCAHTILETELMEISDLLADERFCDNPLVTGETQLRFYAGMPLLMHSSLCLGTLCVMDHKPRQLTPIQRTTLIRLSEVVGALLEARKEHHMIVSHIPGTVYQFSRRHNGEITVSYVSEGCYPLLGVEPQALQKNPSLLLKLILPHDRYSYEQALATSADTLTFLNWEGRIQIGERKEIKWINLRASPRKLQSGEIQWEGIMSNITDSKLAAQEIQRSHEQLRQLSAHMQSVKEEERARIARELHDDLGGNLTALKIDLDWITRRLPQDQPQLWQRAKAFGELLDRTIETTARVARDLRPGILDLGLVAAIEWQAQDFQNRLGIPCTVSCGPDEIKLLPDRETAIFRIFQETLTNISKHAQAARVTVDLDVVDTDIVLRVADDGIGMAIQDRLKPGSFGLLGMLERAKNFGGRVEVHSAPQQGTTITVHIPYVKQDSEEEKNKQQPSLF